MNIIKIVSVFAFIIFTAFAIFGCILINNIAHEFSHKQDYKNIEKISEEICFLNWGEDAAYYGFTYIPSTEDDQEVLRVRKFTETKAITWDIILLLFFGFTYIIVFKRWFE